MCNQLRSRVGDVAGLTGRFDLIFIVMTCAAWLLTQLFFAQLAFVQWRSPIVLDSNLNFPSDTEVVSLL